MSESESAPICMKKLFELHLIDRPCRCWRCTGKKKGRPKDPEFPELIPNEKEEK
jgi:hypothetical protein